MNFFALTLFPELFDAFWAHGIIRQALLKKKITQSTLNIRDFAKGRHRTADDKPYGGGCGMVMKPEPLAGAIRAAKKMAPDSPTILLTPQGRLFTQRLARELSVYDGLILVCGRYEGVDERIRTDLTDHEVSIGDYILTGGELPAMIVIEAVARTLPGVLGGSDSTAKDSFSDGLLEHAHYTRPEVFEGEAVPEVLLSGHHKEIEKWRQETSLIRTFLKRPDLLKDRPLSTLERQMLKKWRSEIDKIIYA
ncbi:MAG: tRNA (guanosine(37)-N1)-methyltransferase TrmD [Desulfobacterales bacterium]|nr:tRNA (guanosine(37)-N1)-methyltransferase TrmD [Desulfobacterales bacterium]